MKSSVQPLPDWKPRHSGPSLISPLASPLMLKQPSEGWAWMSPALDRGARLRQGAHRNHPQKKARGYNRTPLVSSSQGGARECEGR